MFFLQASGSLTDQIVCIFPDNAERVSKVWTKTAEVAEKREMPRADGDHRVTCCATALGQWRLVRKGKYAFPRSFPISPMQKLCATCGVPLDQETSVSLLHLPKLDAPSQSLTCLLESNEIPLEPDLPFLRDLVSNAQDRLDAFNAQIDSLHATLAQLTRRRDETAEYVRQHRAVISPLRRMPPELLCEIFELAWRNEDDEDRTRTAVPPPWYLGHISRSWRDAAVPYAPLWCSISITFIDIDDHPLPMLETQLARSGNAPLNIFWRCGEYYHPLFLEQVVAQCGRWRALYLTVRDPDGEELEECYDDTLLAWLLPTAGRLAQLQKLDLVSDPDVPVPDVFLAAPALRDVVLDGQDFGEFPLLPWTQITRYRGTAHMDSHLDILKIVAPLLVECTIALDEGDNREVEAILLPRLRLLCVHSFVPLDCVETPSLHTLSSFVYQDPTHLLSFLQRSSCTSTLTKLVLMISHCYETSSDFVALFQGLPALTYLFAADPVFRRRLKAPMFGALTECPSLTSFLYGYDPTRYPDDNDEDFAWDDFFSMGRSLIQPTRPCRLECLRLVHTDQSPAPLRASIETRLQTLREQGLDARFMSSSEFEDLKGRGDFF
ncbi:hypothetical protein C8R47DRAFT_1070589 [Mycena vitilis]|nr:hypothetical protein C8R47DRAFT_1070589 [Mycena vitilis]